MYVKELSFVKNKEVGTLSVKNGKGLGFNIGAEPPHMKP